MLIKLSEFTLDKNLSTEIINGLISTDKNIILPYKALTQPSHPTNNWLISLITKKRYYFNFLLIKTNQSEWYTPRE